MVRAAMMAFLPLASVLYLDKMDPRLGKASYGDLPATIPSFSVTSLVHVATTQNSP
jgi:hypothetical protein